MEKPSPIKAFRVWFVDGSAVMVDAVNAMHAETIVKRAIESGRYHGKIKRIEEL